MRTTTKLLVAVMCVITLTGCKAKYHLPSISQKDSVRVETQYIERLRIDTVTIEVPREVERIVTKDTASMLQNSLAVSTAQVSAGLLYHSLETKPQTLKREVRVKDIEKLKYKIVYQDRVEVRVQEVNVLHWWQETLIWIGAGASALALVWLTRKLI